MAKISRSFSISKSANDYLDKKAKKSVNVSAFVNKLIEEKMILEMEEELKHEND